jgi:hypothetical protein
MKTSSCAALLVLVFILISVNRIAAFASELAGNHCDREMKAGVLMMGTPVDFDNTHQIKIFRGENEIQRNDGINNSEELTVKIDPRVFNVVFEVSEGNARFARGKCGGKRTTENPATLVISDSGSQDIVIKAVWAKSYSGGVKLSESFTLKIGGMEDASEL